MKLLEWAENRAQGTGHGSRWAGFHGVLLEFVCRWYKLVHSCKRNCYAGTRSESAVDLNLQLECSRLLVILVHVVVVVGERPRGVYLKSQPPMIVLVLQGQARLGSGVQRKKRWVEGDNIFGI